MIAFVVMRVMAQIVGGLGTGAMLLFRWLLVQAGGFDDLNDNATGQLLHALDFSRLMLMLVGQPTIARTPFIDFPIGRTRLRVASQNVLIQHGLIVIGAAFVIEKFVWRAIANTANNWRNRSAAARFAARTETHHFPHISTATTFSATRFTLFTWFRRRFG